MLDGHTHRGTVARRHLPPAHPQVGGSLMSDWRVSDTFATDEPSGTVEGGVTGSVGLRRVSDSVGE